MNKEEVISYKDSGVCIDRGNDFVDYIKNNVSKTFRPQIINGIGSFSSLFDIGELNYKNPVLVTSTDGVGTKLEIASAINDWSTVGIDLVAMCVNDLICQGADPLFFLDYIACDKIVPETMKNIMNGIIEGCVQGKLSLVGGETAEMPGVYKEGTYDLAGFATGIVQKDKILPKIDQMREGDVLIGLHSSGLHSNGFSLVRKIIDSNNIDYHSKCPISDLDETWGKFLLRPTKIYVDICSKLRDYVLGFAHITGGGIVENLPRILPPDLNFKIDFNSLNCPNIFKWLMENGPVEKDEMFRVFNMGIGMILVCKKENLDSIVSILEENECAFDIIGSL